MAHVSVFRDSFFLPNTGLSTCCGPRIWNRDVVIEEAINQLYRECGELKATLPVPKPASLNIRSRPKIVGKLSLGAYPKLALALRAWTLHE